MRHRQCHEILGRAPMRQRAALTCGCSKADLPERNAVRIRDLLAQLILQDRMRFRRARIEPVLIGAHRESNDLAGEKARRNHRAWIRRLDPTIWNKHGVSIGNRHQIGTKGVQRFQKGSAPIHGGVEYRSFPARVVIATGARKCQWREFQRIRRSSNAIEDRRSWGEPDRH